MPQKVIMGLFQILCGRILPLVVLGIAIFVGWLSTTPLPMGTFFATIIPLSKGKLPPTIFGHGHMVGTPPVPVDMVPQPRPENEILRDLPGGYKMPSNGIGMCCRYSAYDDVLVRNTVLWYLLLGGRHIDGAHLYLNHKAIGQGIRDAMERGIKREEIFVTTKLFPTHFGYDKAIATVPTYLEELGLDYIDLVLMHAPGGKFVPNDCKRDGLSDRECRQETWKALSALREKGIMRNVGVSNFVTSHIKDIEELRLAPVANNQFQYNVFSPPKVQDTFNYCLENNITVTAWSSLGGSFQRDQTEAVELLKKMAAKYDKTVSQIMLRWTLQKGGITIPGTGNPKHMKENLSVYLFEISEEDMTAIDQLKYDDTASKFMYMDPEKMAGDN